MTPALLTRMSAPPNSSWTRSARARTVPDLPDIERRRDGGPPGGPDRGGGLLGAAPRSVR